MVELLSNPYVRIWVDPGAPPIAWMVRTETALPSTEPRLRAFYEGVVAAMAELPRSEHGLLVDSRAAVGRNDDVFERVQAEYRFALFGGFAQVAVVLRTVAGRLQLARYGTGATAIEISMFDSTDDAAAFLRKRAA